MWFDARVELAKSCRFCPEITKCPKTNDPVWMITHDVVPFRVKVGGLDKPHGEVIPEVPSREAIADDVWPTPSSRRRLGDVDVIDDPENVAKGHEPEACEEEAGHEEAAEERVHREVHDTEEHHEDLETTLHGHRQDRRPVQA